MTVMFDPSQEEPFFQQITCVGQFISYFGLENYLFLLIFMGHIQNNICIMNSPENIPFLMVLLFVIPLILVLWL